MRLEISLPVLSSYYMDIITEEGYFKTCSSSVMKVRVLFPNKLWVQSYIPSPMLGAPVLRSCSMRLEISLPVLSSYDIITEVGYFNTCSSSVMKVKVLFPIQIHVLGLTILV